MQTYTHTYTHLHTDRQTDIHVCESSPLGCGRVFGVMPGPWIHLGFNGTKGTTSRRSCTTTVIKRGRSMALACHRLRGSNSEHHTLCIYVSVYVCMCVCMYVCECACMCAMCACSALQCKRICQGKVAKGLPRTLSLPVKAGSLCSERYAFPSGIWVISYRRRCIHLPSWWRPT